MGLTRGEAACVTRDGDWEEAVEVRSVRILHGKRVKREEREWRKGMEWSGG